MSDVREILSDGGYWRTVTALSVRGVRHHDLIQDYGTEKTFSLCQVFFQKIKMISENHGGILHEKRDNHFILIFGINQDSSSHAQRAISFARQISEESFGMPIKIGIDTGRVLIREEGGSPENILGPAITNSSVISSMRQTSFLAITDSCASSANINADEVERMTVSLSDAPKIVFFMDDCNDLILSSSVIRLPLRGRDKELRSLIDARKSVLTERKGAQIFLHGPAGCGKTRLIEEFQEAMESDPFLRHAFFQTPQKQNHFFYNLLEQAVKKIGIAEIPSGDYRPIVDYIAHFCGINSVHDQEALCGIVSEYQGDSGTAQAPHATARIILRIIAGIFTQQPCSIIIEDAHWASDELYAFLDEISLLNDSCSIFTIVTSRENVPDGYAGDFISVNLPPLNAGDVRNIVDDILEENENSDLAADILYQKTKGSPLLLSETINFLTASMAADKNKDRSILNASIQNASIPEGIHGLVEKELSGIDVNTRHKIFALSFFGGIINAPFVTNIFCDDHNFYSGVDFAVRSGLIVRTNGLEDSYVFRHDLIRKAIYESVPAGKRKEVHGFIFERIKSISAKEAIPQHRSFLAYHALKSGKFREAYKNSLILVKRHVSQFRPREALKHIADSLECLDNVKHSEGTAQFKRARILTMKARCHFLLSEFSLMQRALDDAERALGEKYINNSILARIFHTRISYLWIMADYNNAIDEAFSYIEKNKMVPRESAAGHLRLAGIYADAGNFKDSIARCESALSLINKENVVETYDLAFPAVGYCYATLARSYAWLGDQKNAQKNIRAALKSAQLQPEISSRIYCLCFCSEACYLIGNYEQALSLASEARDISEAFGVNILLQHSKCIEGLCKVTLKEPAGLQDVKMAIKSINADKRPCRLALKYFFKARALHIMGDDAGCVRALMHSITLADRNGEAGTHFLSITELLDVIHRSGINVKPKKVRDMIRHADRLRKITGMPLKSGTQIVSTADA